MSDTALTDDTWLQRAQNVTVPSGQPNRADMAKRNPTKIAAILQLLSEGVSYNAAAEANGVTYRTFKAWREQSPELDNLAKEAVATAYAQREANIATDKTWKAQVAWLAARKHMFADPDWTSQQNQGSSGITVNITLRQDDTPSLVDVTPTPPVLGQDKG